MSEKVIAIDIGGTTTMVSVVDTDFKILDLEEFETSHNLSEVLDSIKAIADKYDPEKQLPVGISICGLISIDGERLLLAPNMNWRDINIHETFHVLERDFIVVNDATSAAWASYITEKTGGVKRLLSITLGTGVGGGLVIDGCLTLGAGELGHMKIDFDGPSCNCGKTGCLETYVGAKHIPKRAKEWFDLDVKSSKEIFDLAEQGNQKAIDFWKKVGQILGYTLSGVVNLNGIQEITIGGKVSDAEKYFLEELENTLNDNLMVPEEQKCKVFVSKWKHSYSLIGAASIVIKPPKKLFD
jgi:glucokinase